MKTNIQKIILVFTIILMSPQWTLALTRNHISACNYLLEAAKNASKKGEALSPRYFNEPFSEDRDFETTMSDAAKESLHQLKNMGLSFKDFFLKGEGELIIGLNEESKGRKLQPGLYVQKKDKWYLIPTDSSAYTEDYTIRPYRYKNKDTSKTLHIMTFHLNSTALQFSIILDEFDATTKTGIPKIIVRNRDLSATNVQVECIKESGGRIGLRVFAKSAEFGGDELIVGSSFEDPISLRKNLSISQED